MATAVGSESVVRAMRAIMRVIAATAAALCWITAANAAADGLARPFAGPDVPAIYARLLPRIDRIAIFDNHAHPGFPDDADVDAQAVPPGMTEALRMRASNPEMIAAARALFGYPYRDSTPDHTRWLVDRKAALQKSHPGTAYFDTIWDKLHIEAGLANRVAMPDYLDPQRFRWVFFVDSLLFPFASDCFYANYPDDRTYLPLQHTKLAREMEELGVTELPADLAGYVQMMRQLNELHQRHGGVAMKFEAAYFRPLTFGDPTTADAAQIYAKYRAGDTPSYDDYLSLQDYLFRQLLADAERLQLPVHFHTSIGIGDYFSIVRGSVMNLEPVLRDTRYDKVTFVLLHGGYPEDQRANWLAARKNVYFDTSLMSEWLYPEQFKQRLKIWLTTIPEKVVFGSDAFPFNAVIGVEESAWVATRTARTALAAALAELVSEGALDEPTALRMAKAYLHDTAAGLYPVRSH